MKINSGKSELAIAPEYGGAIVYCRLNGLDVFRPAKNIDAVMNDPRNAACYPCVPYFGRLNSVTNVEGDSTNLSATMPNADLANALQGEGWVSAWNVVAQEENFVTLEYNHAPSSGRFPFAYKAAQSFLLSEKSLAIDLSVANTSDEAMPAGLGFHPFFKREASTMIRFNSQRFWQPPAQNDLGKLGPVPSNLDFSKGRRAPPNGIDHTFARFGGDAEIVSDNVGIKISSDAPHLHFYAPANEEFFCLEPVTHLPGAFGTVIISPGDALNINMKINA